MDDVVRIEYRGILGDLPVGSIVTVEKCEAGVLHLRAAPLPVVVQPVVNDASQAEPEKESDDAR